MQFCTKDIPANPAECPLALPTRFDPCSISYDLTCNYAPVYCCGHFAWFEWEMQCKEGTGGAVDQWVGQGDFGECGECK